MPTTYAHWRFGDHCIKTLPDQLQELINNNRDIFNFGVHGPDIFFYYDCIKHNDVNMYGTIFHDVPFKDSLEKMRPLYLKADDKKSVLSYLLGFTCHFTLDSYCHGFIDLIDQTTDVTHGRLESQYDRHLLIKDKLNPIKTKRYSSLKPGRRIAHDISTLYPEFDDATIYKTIKDMLYYLKLLTDDSDLKRIFLIKLMETLKVKKFIDLLITKENDVRCNAYVERLDKYFDKAVEHYKILALSLVDFLEKGKPLDPYFHNHFNPKEDYKQIPVLSLKEELEYKVDFQR